VTTLARNRPARFFAYEPKAVSLTQPVIVHGEQRREEVQFHAKTRERWTEKSRHSPYRPNFARLLSATGRSVRGQLERRDRETKKQRFRESCDYFAACATEIEDERRRPQSDDLSVMHREMCILAVRAPPAV